MTSVIRNQIQALAGESSITDVLVLHGPGVDGWPNRLEEQELARKLNKLEFREIPELGYRENQILDDQLFHLIQRSIAESGFGPEDTLIQVHNHNLGKNNLLTAVLPRLVNELGFRMLLQIHDFAEDMRPSNFVEIGKFGRLNNLETIQLLYPEDPRIHFAFLNHRDLEMIQGKFADRGRCHLLPNPVSAQPIRAPSQDGNRARQSAMVRQSLDCAEDEQLIIYPVRAIRRKNVAEALLLSATGQKLKMAVTLPAVSVDEVGPYQMVKQTAESLGLPIIFEAGQRGLDFVELVDAADFVFSSSVAEGFGMVFLESWSWGKHLIGRNLSQITQDFKEEGLNLDGLYQAVKIPLEWIDLDRELKDQQNLMDKILDQFGLPGLATISFEKEKKAGWIDFAKLCHRSQLKIVEQVWENPNYQKQILDENPQFRVPEFDANLVQQMQLR